MNTAHGQQQKTPLIAAAANGNTESVNTLLALGAQHGGNDADGKSPFDYAEKQGATNLAAVLPPGTRDERPLCGASKRNFPIS